MNIHGYEYYVICIALLTHPKTYHSMHVNRYTHRQGSTLAVFRYPEHPRFSDGYQIRRNSNPAGLPVFTAIWGPGFRASIIILAHMLQQIKQIRITLMTMFKVNNSPPNEVRYLICTQRRGTRAIVVLFILHVASMHRAVCFEGETPDFQTW